MDGNIDRVIKRLEGDEDKARFEAKPKPTVKSK